MKNYEALKLLSSYADFVARGQTWTCIDMFVATPVCIYLRPVGFIALEICASFTFRLQVHPINWPTLRERERGKLPLLTSLTATSAVRLTVSGTCCRPGGTFALFHVHNSDACTNDDFVNASSKSSYAMKMKLPKRESSRGDRWQRCSSLEARVNSCF